ncbi:hypothetical protein IMAU30132_00043 [Lactobacillus helveticus]|nr:hypothetical protein [Lactobacillus helveticus]
MNFPPVGVEPSSEIILGGVPCFKSKKRMLLPVKSYAFSPSVSKTVTSTIFPRSF